SLRESLTPIPNRCINNQHQENNAQLVRGSLQQVNRTAAAERSPIAAAESPTRVAVYLSWARQSIKLAEGDLGIGTMNPTLMGCVAGSALLRKAASIAFQNKKRATLTSDIIEFLGISLEDICPI
uniref:Uncharacterized protein n=1 Tax=Chenopodium quinoa TaxID=63459 RepID=A0A803MBB1_CHEQI